MDENTFILFYKAMVQPCGKFTNLVLCPFELGDNKEIEKIQMRY